MGITGTLRSVTEDELERAKRDAAFAARLIDELPDGDEAPLDSNLSAQHRVLSIERFSLNLWESLVWDAPVNVFMGGDYVTLDWDYEEEEDETDGEDDGEEAEPGDDEGEFGDDEPGDDEDSMAMELDPAAMTELAGWLRDIRFADVCEDSGEAFAVEDGLAYDDYGSVDEEEFDEFRDFVRTTAERGQGALFHFA